MEATNERIVAINRGSYARQLENGLVLLPNQPALVPLRFVAMYGWDKSIEFDFSPYTAQMQTRDELGRFSFDWWCPLSEVDGYGRHALALYKGFKLLGANPILRSDGWGVDENYLSASIKSAAEQSRLNMPMKIAAMMSLPYHPFPNQSVDQLIVTQFETDYIPEKHVANVNQFRHLIVTSSFQVPIWKKSGCKIPIAVMTPGVDPEVFAYRERTSKENFKVLILGALTGRKNPLGTIRIFQAASQGDPSWRLTVKTRGSMKTPGYKEIAELAQRDKRINFEIADAHPNHVVFYYHTHDCLLWPSKGEGVGLPPLEAMATGMEVVSSDHSGMGDFIKKAVAWPIKTKNMEPADIPGIGFSREYVVQFGRVGNWWNPDEEDAISQLVKCHDAWKEGKGKGKKASEYVHQYHNLLTQSKSVLDVIQKYE